MQRYKDAGSLLRAMLAGAIALTVTFACSPDREEIGRDDAVNEVGADTVAPGQTANTAPGEANTTEAAETTSEADSPAEADRNVPAYRPMEGDTTTQPGDPTAQRERLDPTAAGARENADTLVTPSDSAPIRPPEDSAEASSAISDTATGVGTVDTAAADIAAEEPMARDTGVTVAQGDTVGIDTASFEQDTAAIGVQVDTTIQQIETEIAAADQPDTAIVSDTVTVVGDSAAIGKPGERMESDTALVAATDTLTAETETIRPPEDSVESYGQIAPDTAEAEADIEPAAAARDGEAAVTDAAVLGSLSRQGIPCVAIEQPVPFAPIRQMSNTPITLNPCGIGTMQMSWVVTGR